MTELIERLTVGQWLVLLSLFASGFCTQTDRMQRTAIWFGCLFAANYVWLKWTAQHLEPGFFGFYLLRVAAELIVILAIIRHKNRLSRWLICLEAGMIAANLLATLVYFHDLFTPLYTYKKATILALESLQVFAVFFCITPVYRYFVERTQERDADKWLARSMTPHT